MDVLLVVKLFYQHGLGFGRTHRRQTRQAGRYVREHRTAGYALNSGIRQKFILN